MGVRRASTTASVLATLDTKLVELSNRTATEKTMKEAYDKGYQATLREVVDKQKDSRNAPKTHVFTSRSGITDAGRVELQREQERQQRLRERAKNDGNDENSMDIDEPSEGSKGKGRKWVHSPMPNADRY